MFDVSEFRSGTSGPVALAMPFTPEHVIDTWSAVRIDMSTQRDAAFTATEWAYLVSFLSRRSLGRMYNEALGQRIDSNNAPAVSLLRPRGTIAIWLPNNVSLLGPLTLVVASLSANPIRAKAGSSSEDLASRFLEFARSHAPKGAFRDYLNDSVSVERFGRDDARNVEMSSASSVRIVFGSDDAVRAIGSLPRPIGSVGFEFADRESQAWIEPGALSEAVLDTLIRTFAIYGRTGCTSPRKVVLIGGDHQNVLTTRDQLIERWGRVVPDDVDPHLASDNLMSAQWGRTAGLTIDVVPRNKAVIYLGESADPEFGSHLTLNIVNASLTEAVAALPPNIQTIGHAVEDASNVRWLEALSQSAVKRFVPLAQIHHFGATWDGYGLLRGTFEEVVLN